MLMPLSDPVLSWEHFITFFAGASGMGLVAHAVNSFPTPINKYGQWFLGCIKFAVGQRVSAMNAFQGRDTMVVGVPQGTGAGLKRSAEQTNRNIEVNPGGG